MLTQRMMTMNNTTHTFTIEKEQEGVRLDQFLSEQFPELSRSLFKTLIEQKHIAIDGVAARKAGVKLKEGMSVVCTFPPEPERPEFTQKELESLGIEIVFEHEDFLVINKPAGVLVHPASSYETEPCITDWLTGLYKNCSFVGTTIRPGIVHRIDKDTSGLLIIARNNAAQQAISDMFKERKMKKTYYALVTGHPEKTGTVALPLGRHHTIRNKMAHVKNGREATTHYKVKEYFEQAALVEVNIITGRTHQIRVHFSSIGHPLVGDVLYGKPSKLIKRQALHAGLLSFTYASVDYNFELQLPQDFEKALSQLRVKESFLVE